MFLAVIIHQGMEVEGFLSSFRMIMACALVRIIKTIPQERDGTWERHRVTDNTWGE
jgi:hypothetical protein